MIPYPKNTDQIGGDERSLLLYFESCAVEQLGKVDLRRMNDRDHIIAKIWNENGFVKFGRIQFAYIKGQCTHWCELSDGAWDIAHRVRKERALRVLSIGKHYYGKVGVE